ncbi:hypothetical protein BVG16_13865 [Paenibacillus selenitireducens]|uniref:YolD-like family protein n=1 Tax=Paenibacillus selenitireducens TaxID=1324314 RepID=A0A1T2XDF3_9BACL|nr:hypothetical protein BVG16_13865 [Paenibacillus selenitireducens]
MGKKLDGNGLFESSRFIMPQHREALNEQARQKLLNSRPELDPQELDMIAQAIDDSYSEGTQLGLELFDEYNNMVINGVIIGVNQQRGIVQLDINGEIKDIKLKNIIGVK